MLFKEYFQEFTKSLNGKMTELIGQETFVELNISNSQDVARIRVYYDKNEDEDVLFTFFSDSKSLELYLETICKLIKELISVELKEEQYEERFKMLYGEHAGFYLLELQSINGTKFSYDKTNILERVITVTEAAEILKKDVNNVRRDIGEKYRARKSGATWLIDRESL